MMSKQAVEAQSSPDSNGLPRCWAAEATHGMFARKAGELTDCTLASRGCQGKRRRAGKYQRTKWAKEAASNRASANKGTRPPAVTRSTILKKCRCDFSGSAIDLSSTVTDVPSCAWVNTSGGSVKCPLRASTAVEHRLLQPPCHNLEHASRGMGPVAQRLCTITHTCVISVNKLLMPKHEARCYIADAGTMLNKLTGGSEGIIVLVFP